LELNPELEIPEKVIVKMSCFLGGVEHASVFEFNLKEHRGTWFLRHCVELYGVLISTVCRNELDKIWQSEHEKELEELEEWEKRQKE
jgi:hypothetical protein